MKVIDPGHKYQLLVLDGDEPQTLTFVKRCDLEHPERFPGNTDSHPGTTLQSVLRACIERVKYLQKQIPCNENVLITRHLDEIIYLLERRAARRHGRPKPAFRESMNEPMCPICGHVTCEHQTI